MNRKIYRHKPTGELFKQTNTLEIRGMEDMESDGLTLPIWLVEQSDDWEEVKESPQVPFKEHTSRVKQVSGEYVKEEPNYLITAFRFKDCKDVWTIKENGLYNDTEKGMFTLNEMLKGSISVESDAIEIYSVKNSKGEEFTIGDVIKRNDKDFKLISFAIHKDGCYVIGEDEFGQIQSSINLLRKPKSAIYTTTDGVEVFEGDKLTLFIAHKDLSIPFANEVGVNRFNNAEKEIAERYLTFTSEENRDKYIKENQKKPLFISADSVEIFEGDIVYKAILESKTIVPYHARKGECATEGGVRFSRHEAASEYLKRLNPVFTSADGKEFYSGDTDYSLFSVLPKANWQENRYRLNDCIKFPKKEWLHFHTKEARQKYIDNNKPKYSLNDIEKAYSNTLSPIQSPLFNSLKSNLINLGK